MLAFQVEGSNPADACCLAPSAEWPCRGAIRTTLWQCPVHGHGPLSAISYGGSLSQFRTCPFVESCFPFLDFQTNAYSTFSAKHLLETKPVVSQGNQRLRPTYPTQPTQRNRIQPTYPPHPLHCPYSSPASLALEASRTGAHR